jgi:thiol-disulfide isomerase/thioredoxin
MGPLASAAFAAMSRQARAIAFLAALLFAWPAGSAEPFKPWKGGATPPLALKSLGGEPVDLAGLRGKVVLVNFWATWCAPCVEEMPALARLRDRLAPRGFEVVAVNQGEMPQRVNAFVVRTGLDLPILMDRDKEAARAWRVRALPTTFVVDASGRIRFHAEGEIDAGSALEELVRPLLPRERPSSAAR